MPPRSIGQVRLQRRGVHRDQRVRAAPGVRMSRGAKGRKAEMPPGSPPAPDLGREVGQRDQVVADQGGRRGEAVAGEPHAIPRVAREVDDNPLLFL